MRAETVPPRHENLFDMVAFGDAPRPLQGIFHEKWVIGPTYFLGVV